MIKEKKYLNEIDMLKLDKDVELVPLYWDAMFKAVFTSDLELLKKFILLQLSEVIDPDICSIRLLNNELVKDENNESKKTLDIYVNINDNIFVDIEVNTELYKYIEHRNALYLDKLHTLIFKSGSPYELIKETKIIQLNLNAHKDDNKIGRDIIVSYGLDTNNIYQNNKCTVLKNLEYYRNLYYNGDVKLNESELWLVMLTSRNFVELFNISSKIFNYKERDKFIRKVIDMCNLENFSIHEWEKEKMDKLVEETKLYYAREEGIEDGIRETAINMIKNNFDIETISKITNLSIEEIIEIKESL